MDATEEEATTTPAAPQTEDHPRRGRSVPELAGLVVVLVVLVVFFIVKSPYFLGADNILNILTAIAVTGIIAVPATMLMVAGQVDLSVELQVLAFLDQQKGVQLVPDTVPTDLTAVGVAR